MATDGFSAMINAFPTIIISSDSQKPEAREVNLRDAENGEKTKPSQSSKKNFIRLFYINACLRFILISKRIHLISGKSGSETIVNIHYSNSASTTI